MKNPSNIFKDQAEFPRPSQKVKVILGCNSKPVVGLSESQKQNITRNYNIIKDNVLKPAVVVEAHIPTLKGEANGLQMILLISLIPW